MHRTSSLYCWVNATRRISQPMDALGAIAQYAEYRCRIENETLSTAEGLILKPFCVRKWNGRRQYRDTNGGFPYVRFSDVGKLRFYSFRFVSMENFCIEIFYMFEKIDFGWKVAWINLELMRIRGLHPVSNGWIRVCVHLEKNWIVGDHTGFSCDVWELSETSSHRFVRFLNDKFP